MKVTKNIQNALKMAIESCDSQRHFSEKTGITQSSLSKYLSGQNKVIRADNWERLVPYIRAYLWDEKGSCAGVAKKLGEFLDEPIAIQAAKACELNLDLADRPTYLLLEYWRDMADAQRFALLQHADTIFKEKNKEKAP